MKMENANGKQKYYIYFSISRTIIKCKFDIVSLITGHNSELWRIVRVMATLFEACLPFGFGADYTEHP